MKSILATLVMITFLSFTTNKGEPEKKYRLDLTGQQLSIVIRSIRTVQGVANYDETNALLQDIDSQLQSQIKQPAAPPEKKDSLPKKP